MKRSSPKPSSSAPRNVASQATHSAAFHFQASDFVGLAEQGLAEASRLGVSSAVIGLTEDNGLQLGVRMGELETVEHTRNKGMDITVFVGQQRGQASTSDFAPRAIAETVRAAYDIARFTAADDFAGLPPLADLVDPAQIRTDLDLYHPWALSTEAALDLALSCEEAALATDARVQNSEGASVSTNQGHFYSAQMEDGQIRFGAGYASSSHSISVSPLAVSKTGDMQRDYWFSAKRAAGDLADPRRIGRYAAERALSRLDPRPLPKSAGSCPVLFENVLGAGLLGSFAYAVSGAALYRKFSFLLDHLGKAVFPAHISVVEDPFVRRGKASCPFDEDGVAVRARKVVDAGILQGYFLNTYTARKLGMQNTGNAGGSHNLVLQSSLTQKADTLDAMLKKLHRGLFVTELMGDGVNYVTGDYSRGAAGYWVENGQIAYPVQEATIAGNLRDMLRNITAIGADAYTYGGKTSGSVIVENLTVAGGNA